MEYAPMTPVRNAEDLKAQHEEQLKKLASVLKDRIAPSSVKKESKGKSKNDLASVLASSGSGSGSNGKGDENVEPPSSAAKMKLFTPLRLKGSKDASKKSKSVPASASSAAAATVKPVIIAPKEIKTWQEAILTMDLSGLTQAERNRQESIYELIRSETEFVAVLEMIEQNYFVPIQRARMFSIKEYDTIFANFSDLLVIHRKFLQELQTRQAENFIFECVGDALVTFIHDAATHINYGGNQSRMEAEVRRHLQVHREFIAFINSLNEQSKSKRIMFNIREDLNKPNVRMQQYSQFFKDILIHTSESHEDQATIKLAIDGFESLMGKIAEKKKEAENMDRISELQASIDFSVVGNKPILLARNQNSKVTREGRVMLLTLGKEIRARSRKDVFLIVIDDNLYILSEHTDGKKAYKLLYMPANLAHVTTMDVPDLDFDRSNMFELRMTNPLELLVLQSPNSDDKSAWMKLFGFKQIPNVTATGLPPMPVSSSVRSFERRSSASSMNEAIFAGNAGESSGKLQRRPSQTYVKEKRDIFENILELTGIRSAPAPVPVAAKAIGLPPIVPSAAAAAATQSTADYTEQMLGIGENERLIIRSTVNIQALVPGSAGWSKLGVGELVLVFSRGNRKSRLIFVRDEDKDKLRAAAAINTWLQPTPMVNDKVTEKENNKIKLVLIVPPNVSLSTYVVRFRSTQERDSMWEAIDKFKYPDGERPAPVAVAVAVPAAEAVPASPAVSTKSRHSTVASTPSSASTTDSGVAAVKRTQLFLSSSDEVDAVEEEQGQDQDGNDDDDDADSSDGSEHEEEEDDDDENDNGGFENMFPEADIEQIASDLMELSKLRELVVTQQKEMDSLRSTVVEKQLAMTEMLDKRAYEQRKVQEFMSKTKDKQAALQESNAHLLAENEHLKQQLAAALAKSS